MSRPLRSLDVTRIKVSCLECGKKFQTRSDLPVCPKCNSSDICIRGEEDSK